MSLNKKSEQAFNKRWNEIKWSGKSQRINRTSSGSRFLFAHASFTHPAFVCALEIEWHKKVKFERTENLIGRSRLRELRSASNHEANSDAFRQRWWFIKKTTKRDTVSYDVKSGSVHLQQMSRVYSRDRLVRCCQSKVAHVSIKCMPIKARAV